MPEKKQPERNESGDDSDDDDDESMTPEFLDVQEIESNTSSGRGVYRSSLAPRRRVQFQTLGGRVVGVTGRFALRAPWWHITCATQGRNNLILKGTACYRLRTDLDRSGWRPLVSLFLMACNVTQESVARFFEWLPEEQYVAIGNLMEVLGEFEEDDDSGLARSIMSTVSDSVAARRVSASGFYPSVMEHLPLLLPRQFLHLLDGARRVSMPRAADAADAELDDGDRLLAELEDIIKNDVWKLGFHKVMLNELKLVRCEAPLEAFKEHGLLKKMPSLQRNALCAYHELKRFCSRTGSTYMEQEDLCTALRRQPGLSDVQVWEALPFLRNLGVVVCEKQKVALQHLHNYEVGIADFLSHLVNGKRWEIPINVRDVLYSHAEKRQRVKIQKEKQTKDFPPVEVDRYQLQAGEMICANPVTVISGVGGCGKTTVVSLVFQAAVEQECSTSGKVGKDPGEQTREYPGEDPEGYPGGLHGASDGEKEEVEESAVEELEILLTAPTGRAASLLTKRTGFKAYTLHQVIWDFNMATADSNGRREWKFESVRALVVDEGSLVSVQLLHDVLSLLIKHGKLQKFVILGDVRQLPSIQPGNTLHDLFHSLKVVNYTMEMMKNHRSESELIVTNAKLIADSKRLNFDAVVDLHGTFDIPDSKKFIHIRLPDLKSDDDLQKAVKLLIASAPGLGDHSTSQFIAFRRADVALINELCCTHYNKHTTKDHRGKLNFQLGDKICVTKNAYIPQEGEAQEKPDGEENVETQERVRLCNGEIFFIRQDRTKEDGNGRRKQRLLTLDDGLGRIITAEYSVLRKDCRLGHAWARTIHTFQGSESETVVFVLGAGGGQTWRHVYTAVTRGQKRVYVVSSSKALQVALKWKETPRHTRLQGLVKTQVVQMLQSTPGHHHHRGLPHFTPLDSRLAVPREWTPCRSQAAYASTSHVHVRKRLWGPAEVKESPDESMRQNLDAERGTSRDSESGTPRKQPKWLDGPMAASGSSSSALACRKAHGNYKEN